MSTTKTFFSRASTFFWRDLFISSCILETLVTMGGLPLKGSSSTVATAESQPNQGSAITIFCAWEDGSTRVFVSNAFLDLSVYYSQSFSLTSGALMMLYTEEISVFVHGIEVASKLQGSTPHEREFQSFFAKGCVLLHVSMAVWRVSFERKLDILLLIGLDKLLET
ncbi:hypothetical protein QYF36_019669 [Acer negundo]|nr:hypothetical protein QYF36_019669 [Acer negundo]